MIPDYVYEAAKKTGAVELLELCDDAHPDHENYRKFARTLAGTGHPSLFERVASAAEAAAGFVASGFAVVSPETLAERLAICEPCPQFTSERRCKLCACPMDLKAKLPEMVCPIDKW